MNAHASIQPTNPIAALTEKLMEPPPGLAYDYSQPAGEPALIAATSISWKIFKNPAALFIGGVAAVIMELAEPSVRTGVWDHSSFQRDPAMRLRRTGAAAMMTVYGPQSAARSLISRVVKMHGHVIGETPDGTPYHANDERLLNWVQATASFGFIEAYSQFVAPLTDAQKSQAFREGATASHLYGALGAPQSLEEWEQQCASMLPSLEPSPIIEEYLAILRSTALVSRLAQPMQNLLIKAAIDIVPVSARELACHRSASPHGNAKA